MGVPEIAQVVVFRLRPEGKGCEIVQPERALPLNVGVILWLAVFKANTLNPTP